MSTFPAPISGCTGPLFMENFMLYVCAVSEQLSRVVLAWNNFGNLIDTLDAYMYMYYRSLYRQASKDGCIEVPSSGNGSHQKHPLHARPCSADDS